MPSDETWSLIFVKLNSKFEHESRWRSLFYSTKHRWGVASFISRFVYKIVISPSLWMAFYDLQDGEKMADLFQTVFVWSTNESYEMDTHSRTHGRVDASNRRNAGRLKISLKSFHFNLFPLNHLRFLLKVFSFPTRRPQYLAQSRFNAQVLHSENINISRVWLSSLFICPISRWRPSSDWESVRSRRADMFERRLRIAIINH